MNVPQDHIVWGVDKCKVLEVGAHKVATKSWALGEQIIGSYDSYKYLGEIITRNGKNEENWEARFKKSQNYGESYQYMREK